jgi:hypothetical protein
LELQGIGPPEGRSWRRLLRCCARGSTSPPPQKRAQARGFPGRAGEGEEAWPGGAGGKKTGGGLFPQDSAWAHQWAPSRTRELMSWTEGSAVYLTYPVAGNWDAEQARY